MCYNARWLAEAQELALCMASPKLLSSKVEVKILSSIFG
jgi:hypothetical protein